MCMQCAMGAMTAGAAATGARSYLQTRAWAWLTSARLHRITVVLLVAAVLAASTLLAGSGG
ncbi:hypothetical protein [Conexibacter sp. SYSU D00693]|uniref:hypothetical protein n=1 Tax=Conexibacter sp. SYSU D00693 TaxID=2812560 RepID=UPI00196B0E8A|nr:hypothetical protein [Conexibacter sp. SYSU D00693]